MRDAMVLFPAPAGPSIAITNLRSALIAWGLWVLDGFQTFSAHRISSDHQISFRHRTVYPSCQTSWCHRNFCLLQTSSLRAACGPLRDVACSSLLHHEAEQGALHWVSRPHR